MVMAAMRCWPLRRGACDWRATRPSGRGRRGPDCAADRSCGAVQLTDVMSDAARAAYAQLVATAVADNGGRPPGRLPTCRKRSTCCRSSSPSSFRAAARIPRWTGSARSTTTRSPRGSARSGLPWPCSAAAGASRGRRTGCSIRWIPIRLPPPGTARIPATRCWPSSSACSTMPTLSSPRRRRSPSLRPGCSTSPHNGCWPVTPSGKATAATTSSGSCRS